MTALLTADQTTAPTEVQRLAESVTAMVSGMLAGRQYQIEIVTACALARGHLLIEDVPGVGKTLLAQSLASAIGGSFSRIQGTADLLPSDIVGSLTPTGDGLGLHFRPGPILANVVLFDELNRVNARTQSSLLEVLEEGHVTVDGVAHHVPDPFVVIATQNPSAMAGTYPLAEGLADRFMAVISLGRASADEEVEILTGRRGRTRLHEALPVAAPADIARAQLLVDDVHLHDAVARYAVDILHATRRHPRVQLGASTRAGVGMIGLAKSFAAMAGRDHVTPHDVVRAAGCSLAHRVGTWDEDRRAAAEVVADSVAAVPAPRR